MQDNKPRSRNPRDNAGFGEDKQFQEAVINIDRVARVVKGGRRFRFKALVVIGDGKDKVGVGVDKGADVQAAITKATDKAKKSMFTIPLYKETIPHETSAKVGGAHIMLKSAAPGTGIIAGGTVRTILNVTGIRNVLSKSLGSSNKVNTAYATLEALSKLKLKNEWVTSGAPKTTKASSTASKTAAPKAKSEKTAKKPAAKKAEKKS